MASPGELADRPLILASASPVRAALLMAAGLDFAVDPADLDESAIKRRCRDEGRSAEDCAEALAVAKARSVAIRHPDALVIGADQLLVCAGAWLDKPADKAAARARLTVLRGRKHALATAACVVCKDVILWQMVSRPELTMRGFSDAFLDRYLAAEGEAILGSVGAYRLEGRGIQLFDGVEGDHFAILGLPLLQLLAFLRDRGVIGH